MIALKTLFVALVALLVPTVAFAAPTLVPIEAFSGDETVIDFEDLADEEPLRSQYFSQGVFFSSFGGVFAESDALDRCVSGFVSSTPGTVVCSKLSNEITMGFTETTYQIGFQYHSFSNSPMQVAFSRGGQVTALLTVGPLSENDYFVGFEDPEGFDAIEIFDDDEQNFAINDLRIGGVILDIDSDGDGVLDEDDLCPNTLEGEIVDVAGCSISDLNECNGDWKNHGKYVSSVVHTTQAFVEAGLITQDEMDAIVSAAAQSDCGKK